jgi:hypothetical protein
MSEMLLNSSFDIQTIVVYFFKIYSKKGVIVMEAPVAPVSPVPPTPASKTNVLSIISLVGGILGLLGMCLGVIPVVGLFCSVPGGLFGLAALILGLVGINKVKTTGEKGRGMAIAGLILGVLTLLGLCVYVIISIALGPVIGNIFSQINNSLNY